MPERSPGRPRDDQRWSTFLRNHARAIVACDFFVAVTASFRLLFVLMMIEHGLRRLLHLNVTAHPTAAWTLQPLREALGYERRYRYLIHDRDRIFAKSLDESIGRLGLKVLKAPFRNPKANAICERSIGTIRRECLDCPIPMSEAHLRVILKEWRAHYNGSRPHMALGPGVPDPPPKSAALSDSASLDIVFASGFVVLAQVGVGRTASRVLSPTCARMIGYLRSTGHTRGRTSRLPIPQPRTRGHRLEQHLALGRTPD